MTVKTERDIIVELQQRLAQAEHRIAQLESAGRSYGLIPNSPSFGFDPAKCGKCGLKMEGVMGYVCPNGGDCPTGLGGFSCSVGNGAITRNDVAVTVTNTSATRPNPANGAPKPPGHNPVA